MLKYISLLLFVLLIGCQRTYYFPVNESETGINVENQLDSFQNRWYSGSLKALREPVLKDLQTDKEIYRYTNIGTWTNPYCLRVEKSGDQIIIVLRRCGGQGGFNPGVLVENRTRRLTQADYDKLMESLDKIDFWNLNTHPEITGLDGSEWIIEGYKDGKYHFVTRWSPDYESDFAKACHCFGRIVYKK